MKILLDTHALLWWLDNDAKIGSRARRLIADPENDLLISVASLWEIAIKLRVGKLKANLAEIYRGILRDGAVLLDIRLASLVTLSTLPLHHRDLFDRLLIAQAITETATFISEDHNTFKYAVRAVPCSDPPSGHAHR